jgi:hypothetical protein
MFNRMNAASLPAAHVASAFAGLGEEAARRVYLAAMSPDRGSGIALGGRVLHRLRIVVIVPGGRTEPWRAERLIGPLPCLPQSAAPERDINSRPVHGEILRDERGRFYERVGKRIRPIAELAASADGEPLVVEGRVEREPEKDSVQGAPRPLFAPPGLWRVVPFGEFKPLLAPQLAHPERLRDSHQIPCYVQVCEASGDVPLPKSAQPWSDAAAARLQISVAAARGRRFFALQVASDPTAEAPAPAQPDAPRAAYREAPRSAPGPWEFPVSREEAVYDMQHAAAREGPLRRMLMRLAPPVKRADLTKWHALIAGKSPAQQLWEVSPPRNGLRDPRVRQRIAEALRLAHVPPRSTLDEWEIHWRRRGLH